MYIIAQSWKKDKNKSRSSGLCRLVVLWQHTNVSNVHAASIFKNITIVEASKLA
jgi:hypothetical protein